MYGKYVCIHAHFYQPPRENPWLDEVEIEESADPYHDWNQRIARECYDPNSTARVLKDGKIRDIVNNYEKISFNFGPTLFSWMERHEPEVYEKILDADRLSSEKRNGHGNAIAQVYNHSIMPLNSKRDMETQVIWGIKDFEYRFGRQTEGIWFAETAVDRESLLIAARHGIKYAILAPNQAKSIRPLKPESQWESSDGKLDTTMPYLYRPDDKSEIALFFYNGELSHSIAFDGLLKDGMELGRNLLSAFGPIRDKDKKENCLVHVATDGESYGHHHKFGEMALAAALEVVESDTKVNLTNYGEFLERNPPVMEVEIHENSSWSCAHGVERWRSDCGCTDAGRPGWDQKWRAPLRNALNMLKGELDNLFEEGLSRYLKSPWDARNDYIEVIVNRGEKSVNRFLERHAKNNLSPQQVTETLKYFEMQVAAMKMFTSCGWFFADVSRLETLQVMKYAARAIEISQELSLLKLEDRFLNELSKAKSNIKDFGTGADIYEKLVQPLKMDHRQVAAHWLISGMLKKEQKSEALIYSYRLQLLDSTLEDYMDTVFMTGIVRLTSTNTLESKKLVFCLLRFGGHDFNCSIRPYLEERKYLHMKNDLMDAFKRHSMPEMIHTVEKHFGRKYYTIRALFDDERRKLVKQLLTDHIARFGEAYRELFEQNSKLMDFFADVDVPIPEEFRIAAKYVFEKRLNKIFTNPEKNHDNLKDLAGIIKETGKWDIRLSYKLLHKNAVAYLEYHIKKLCNEKVNDSLKIVEETMWYLESNNVMPDIWTIQKLLFPFYQAADDKESELYACLESTPGFEKLFKLFGFADRTEKTPA